MAHGTGTGGAAPPFGRLPAVLAALFPPFVATAVLPVSATLVDAAHPEERAAVAGAAAGRRAEFVAGRACAHAALDALGLDGPPVGRGPAREPLWPAGAVGSIAHTAGAAAAAVARAAQVWGLGLDLEPLDPPLDAGVERLVLTPAERAALPVPLAVSGKVAFCAKECVYKAVFPATRWPLDFHDVTVEVDLAAQRFRAVVDQRHRLRGVAPAPLAGRFRVAAGLLVAGLWVRPLTGSDGQVPETGR